MYQCNNASCEPCEHEETDILCPNCGNRKLIISPKSNWIFCPDAYRCEWEQEYDPKNPPVFKSVDAVTTVKTVQQYTVNCPCCSELLNEWVEGNEPASEYQTCWKCQTMVKVR